jgi:transposase
VSKDSEKIDGSSAGVGTAQRRDPELSAKAVRRRFTAEYKQRILREADACTALGAIGGLLRREGLYSSHLANWRRQRAAAVEQGLAPRRRGRIAAPVPLLEENQKLRQENARLVERLQQAELIIDVQKKISALLGSAEASRPGASNWCMPSKK